MNYQLYRETTLGQTLQDALDELMGAGKLNNNLAARVLREFDKAISVALERKVKNRLSIKCSRLRTYRFYNNVWTLFLKDAEFREVQELISVDYVKIVACDGKTALMAQQDLNR